MSAKEHSHEELPLKGDIQKFWQERARLNELVLGTRNLQIKRFFSLDHQSYQPGALPVKTKELLGLVASLVLRCDDCINYHIVRCFQEGVTEAEFEETMAIGMVVGGSITIPHVRRAFKSWKELQEAAREAQEKHSK
ncbi:MAG: carboxymuconolactone decarboxylase family protein [Calditrichaeota bacterium]|nr:MAG: carboxymuconolactone decarboxylase family protein [Calditrichota bacterium]